MYVCYIKFLSKRKASFCYLASLIHSQDESLENLKPSDKSPCTDQLYRLTLVDSCLQTVLDAMFLHLIKNKCAAQLPGRESRCGSFFVVVL